MAGGCSPFSWVRAEMYGNHLANVFVVVVECIQYKMIPGYGSLIYFS